MLSFSRKTDYALIALAHLAGSEGRTASAREIGQTYGLSVSLVMKILKVLHHSRIVRSTRGATGGYGLNIDLRTISLFDLIETLRGIEPAADGGGEREATFQETEATLPTQPPLLAVHTKLMRFLKDVNLSDLVLPGRRIDVPVEMVGRRRLPAVAISAAGEK